MKKIGLLVICLLFGLEIYSQSQIIYEEFESNKLNESRRLKIQLPRDYETNTEKVYPIVIVLDANNLRFLQQAQIDN